MFFSFFLLSFFQTRLTFLFRQKTLQWNWHPRSQATDQSKKRVTLFNFKRGNLRIGNILQMPILFGTFSTETAQNDYPSNVIPWLRTTIKPAISSSLPLLTHLREEKNEDEEVWWGCA